MRNSGESGWSLPSSKLLEEKIVLGSARLGSVSSSDNVLINPNMSWLDYLKSQAIGPDPTRTKRGSIVKAKKKKKREIVCVLSLFVV